ncbi:MAG TPA: BBP7 family outer membrane beta-barrel protein, partial [Gemmataceae bacterium]|nr:BBP7 family outer membrane beta-barrel protein [Gemmataceae bacterium]
NNPNPFDIPGTRVVGTDFFGTQNLFFGGQVGTNLELRNGRWSVDLRGSIALGDTHESLVINGSQVHTQPGGAVMSFVGNLLALPGANIGVFSQDHFSFVPEVRLNLGYQITPSIRVFAGYDFLYWFSVIRPGTEIDRVIDLTRVPNPPPPPPVLTPVVPPRPMALFSQQGFIAQGVNLGVQFRW